MLLTDRQTNKLGLPKWDVLTFERFNLGALLCNVIIA